VAARAADPLELLDHRPGVGDVLEHVRAQRQVERPAGERQPLDPSDDERRPPDGGAAVVGHVEADHARSGGRGRLGQSAPPGSGVENQ